MTNDASKTTAAAGPTDTKHTQIRPWPALWAMVIGFFMILVDTTIVSVANPAIKAALDPNTNSLDNVVWVTSAYLLGYAVPLLITGRLGDRFGPRNIYLIGLAIFTLASLGCGLSTSLGPLIAMRAVQGVGASMMTPQTMAVITRTFPPDQRGAAMGLWGATSGVAMLVGPLAGGLLSGKSLDGALPKGSRADVANLGGRLVPSQEPATRAYVELARAHGLDPAAMALAFCMTRPFMLAPIIGATSMDQLNIAISAKDITLSREVLNGIEKIHRQYPLPF